MYIIKVLPYILVVCTLLGISKCAEIREEIADKEERPEREEVVDNKKFLTRAEEEARLDLLPKVEFERLTPELEKLRGPELKVTEALTGQQILRNDKKFHMEVLAPHISIEYKGVRLNVVMTQEEKEKKEKELEIYLHGQSLEHRLAVWARQTNISALVTAYQTGKEVEISQSIDITKNDLFDLDIVLDLNDAIEIEEEILSEIGLGTFPKIKPAPTIGPRTIRPITFRPATINPRPIGDRVPVDSGSTHLQKRETDHNEGIDQGEAKSRQKRKMRNTSKWNLTIKYKFGNSMTTSEMNAIKNAIAHWESLTCISFQQDQGVGWPTNRIVFIKIPTGSGICGSSPVGKRSFGLKNQINIACFDLGTIVHEIGHSIGFWHEHSRPDRDSFVNIHWGNIPSSFHSNMGRHAALTYSVPYDYTSIMHYASSYGGSTWITAKEAWYTPMMGNRIGMSFYDVKLANYHYCSSACGGSVLTWSSCQHGGYRDPNSCYKCRCPIGWTGTYCHLLDRKTECGAGDLIASSTANYINSPNYFALGGHYSQNDHCAWRIVAPAGQHVVAKFVGQFDIRYSSRCGTDWVEVRYRDMSSPGPRFCGGTLPSATFTSDQAHLMVVFRANGPTSSLYRGFRLEYKTESCGLCDYSYSPQPACRSIVSYVGSTKYYTRCGWWGKRCARYTYYKAYKTQDTCCHGTLQGGNCKVNGCGGCQDTLVKNQPRCYPYPKVKYITEKYYTNCGWFGWKRCTRYRQKAVYEMFYPPACCAGFTLVGSRCVK